MPAGSTNVGTIDLSLILNSTQFQNQLRNVVNQANQTSNKVSTSFNNMGKAIIGALSITAITAFGKACVQAATDTTNAWIGLKSILDGQEKSFNTAREYINEYVSDGLVPLNNAVTAYKNLAARGYNTDQIKSVMTALKDAATFGRQSSYSLGDAVESASEGLKNENSVLVDNAGVTKNVAKMWEDYAKSIGKTRDSLTQQEKIQAEVNGILEETKFQTGDASLYSKTYSGRVAELSSAFSTMQGAIGNVVQPIVKAFIPVLINAANAVTVLFNKFASLLALFGLRADTVETIFNGFEKTSANANDTSEAIEGIGDSATKAGKKISKSLAGFDEMNKLNSSNTSGGSGGASSGGEGLDLAGLTEGKDPMIVLEEDTRLLDMLKVKIEEIKRVFKDGFNISFGDTNFNGIMGHLTNIKQALLDIVTDSEINNAGSKFYYSFTYNLGKLVGSIGKIGTNIAEGLIGSIDTYLEQNTERIKNFITNMFNIGTEEFIFVGNFSQALGEISDIFKSDTVKQIGADIIAMFANPFMSALEIAGNFVKDLTGVFVQPIIDNVDKIKEAISNTLAPIQTVTGTIADCFTHIGDKCKEVYDEHIHPFMEDFKHGISDTLSKLLDTYNTYVAPALQRMADKFTEVWNANIQPMFEKFADFCGKVGDLIKVLWNTILKPVIDWFIETIIPTLVPIFETIWNTICDIFGDIANVVSGIINVFSGIIDFIVGEFTGDWSKAWDGIYNIFNGAGEAIVNFCKMIIDSIVLVIKGFVLDIQLKFSIIMLKIKAFFEAIKTIINNIGTTISNAWDRIKTNFKEGAKNAWNSVTSVFGNVANWFRDKFTEAWEAVKNVFSTGGQIFDGIKEGILNGLKTVVNAIITGINKIISVPFNGINSALNKIKKTDILGFKPFDWLKTISVPQIPKLAQGGFVKANTPQLAIIGDNKTQGEIVAPEDKMLELLLKAIKISKDDNSKNNNNNSGGDIIIPIYIDNEQIYRKIIKKNERLQLATNGRGGL